jgi:hypothetical protein
MPVILRVEGFKFFFFSDEGNEPPHVHVEKGDSAAKFWIKPVRLAKNFGMKASELAKVRRIIEANEKLVEEKWFEFSSRKK